MQRKVDTGRDPKVIGAEIRTAREAKSMTQAALAEQVGTSQQTIEKIELGKVKRTSFLYDIYQVLGLRRPPIADLVPPTALNSGEFYSARLVKERREFLGLELSELAAMSGVDAATIEAIEASHREQASPLYTPELWQLEQMLSRLESEEPLGEPFAPFGYLYSALPTPQTRVAHFKMNKAKGITFQGYISSPNVPSVAQVLFCIEIGNWARGIASEGDRLYCRMGVDVRHLRDKYPGLFIATPIRQRPEDIDALIVGDIKSVDHQELVMQPLGEGAEIRLVQADWNLSTVVTGVWSDATFNKIRTLK